MRRRRTYHLLSGLAIAALTGTTHAQETREIEILPSADAYQARYWSIRDGLPQTHVTAIEQSPDGLLWLSTYGGIARFDGLEFDVLGLSTHPNLTTNRFRSLTRAGGKGIWIGTEGRGVARYQDGSARLYPDMAKGETVFTLLEDRENRLWIGTPRGVRFLKDQIERRVPEVGDTVHDLYEDEDGTIWIAGNGGLWSWRDGVCASVLAQPRCQAILRGRDGSLWVASRSQTLIRLQNGREMRYQIPGQDPVRTIVQDHEGTMWFATDRRLLYWKDDTLHDAQLGDSFLGHASTAFVDREGSLWFGGRNGLSQVRRSPMSGIRYEGASARAMTVDGSGNLWAAMQDGTLWRIDDSSFLPVIGPAGAGADSLASLATGDVLAASEQGFWIAGAETSKPRTAFETSELATCRALHEDGRGHLWFGSGPRLVRRWDDAETTWGPEDGMPGRTVLGILETTGGEIWASTLQGVCRLVDDRIVRTWRCGEELPYGGMRSLWEDPRGDVWVGSYGGGLCRLQRSGRVDLIDQDKGLVEGVASRIVSAGDEVIIQGNRALSLIRSDELLAVADGEQNRVYPRVFDSGPGIQVFEGMGGSMPFECRARDGALWFPALEGVVKFDPTHLTPLPTPPAPLIVSMTADGERIPIRNAYQVETNARSVEINFTVATFVDPGSARFRYRLYGYDDEWIEASSRAATYRKLPPGTYRFALQAANSDGTWSQQSTAMTLELPAALSERWWFQALIAIAGIGIVLGGAWHRSRRTRRYARDLEQKVAKRTVELQDTRDHLEEQVHLRTAELAKTLETLRHDVAAREHLEHQLRESQKLESLGRLAGGLAHDFNNILTAIIAQSDLALLSLRDEDDDVEERREGLHVIRDAGERAARLTRQLLAYSRQQILQPEVIQPNDAIRKLEEMLRRLVRADITFRLDLSPTVGCISVDPGQLGQVIVNLVVNANDATEAGGRITIQTRSHVGLTDGHAPSDSAPIGPHVCITVTDTGCGIDAETMTHIFEPFFTTKAAGKGTGLGLASVHGIVTQSGGHIRVESEPSRGTTVDVLLPEIDALPTPTKPTSPRRLEADGNATILLCDDEPSVRSTAGQVLKSAGYRVLSAAGPRDALQLAEQHRAEIDLLITDLIMPEMRGDELARELKRRIRGLQVLMITGYSAELLDPSDQPEGSQLLHKPFDSTTLRQAVAEILTQSTK